MLSRVLGKSSCLRILGNSGKSRSGSFAPLDDPRSISTNLCRTLYSSRGTGGNVALAARGRNLNSRQDGVRGHRNAKGYSCSSVEETKHRLDGAPQCENAQPLGPEPSHHRSLVSGELARPGSASSLKKESLFAVQPKEPTQDSSNGDREFFSMAQFTGGVGLEESQTMPSKLSAELHPACDSQPGVQFNEEQMAAIEHVRKGHNLFLTGCGGTGKSTVLREIIWQMTNILGEENVGVCAMTGVAAENVDGCTLHSLLGIGVPYERKDFGKMRNKSNSRRLQRLDLLIIDEVSMLSGEMLDYIDQELKEVRHSPKPFGGLQVLFSGDFYQLPPVRQSKVVKSAKAFNNLGYAFESNAWQSGDLKVVDLAEVHRQRDSEFVLALADLRRGEDTPRFQNLLRQVRRQLPKPVDGIESTILYCHNVSVDRHNLRKLQQIASREVKFLAKDRIYPFGPKESEVKHEKALKAHAFWKNCRASSKLALKEGAQVMLLKNLSQTRGAYLINGSRGVVQGFADSGNPVVRFRNGQSKEVSTEEFTMKIPGVGTCVRLQIPLALAWAVTVHKSQGMTLDRLKVNLDGTFDFGQAYVALSRARSIEALEILSLPRGGLKLRRNGTVENFNSDILQNSFTKTGKWSNCLNDSEVIVENKLEAA